MEGELRLGQLQVAGEIAHAALTARQGLHHLQAHRIGEGLQQLARLISLEGPHRFRVAQNTH